MTRTKLVAVAFAALLVTVGTVAAAPGNAPVDVGADDQYDDHADAADENAADAPEDDDAANESDDRRPDDAPEDDHAENADGAAPDAAAENADRRGPPADLPAQVPDHVAEIHDLIRSFLGGDDDGSLGESVSDATPDDGDENAESA